MLATCPSRGALTFVSARGRASCARRLPRCLGVSRACLPSLYGQLGSAQGKGGADLSRLAGGRHAKCEHVAGIPSGYRRLPGSERGAPSEAELIGPVPAAVPVRVTVVPRPA